MLFAPAARGDVPRRLRHDGARRRRSTEPLEGARARPGHFDGVATVVAKLLRHGRAATSPTSAQKDAQQALVIRRMVRDLDLPVEIEVCPTVREPDGLAMSSRNAYLDADERERALALRRALDAAEALGRRRRARPGAHRRRGARRDGRVRRRAGVLRARQHRGRCRPWTAIDGEALVAVAATVGRARLIDNTTVRTRARVAAGPHERNDGRPNAARDAEVQDPPGDGDRLRPALRRVDHRRPGAARGRGHPRARAGPRRRRRQRRPLRDLHDRRRARLGRHEGQRRRRPARPPRRHDHRHLLRLVRPSPSWTTTSRASSTSRGRTRSSTSTPRWRPSSR